MVWRQLELVTPPAQAETLSKLLEQFSAVSVTLTAASDEPLFDEKDEEKKLWQKTQLTALLPADIDPDIILICLRDRVGADNIFSHQIELLKDKDWVGEYQAEHQPAVFSERICICPTWCEPPDTTLPILILDPGLAFGAGSHPTTSLCIDWLATHDLQNKIVIDYGCGSGILAMTAALLGAKKVYAVDIDPQAILTACENIDRNDLTEKIETGLVETTVLPAADILVANILMNPLKGLCQTFSDLVLDKGDIILSGLLPVQAEECLAVYADYFNMDVPVFSLEWARLNGKKKN